MFSVKQQQLCKCLRPHGGGHDGFLFQNGSKVFFQKSLIFYQPTRHNIPKDSSLLKEGWGDECERKLKYVK